MQPDALKALVRRYRDRLHRMFDRATVTSLALQRGDNIRTLAQDARDLMNAMTRALGAPAQSRAFGVLVTPHVNEAIRSLGVVERKMGKAGMTGAQVNQALRGLLRGEVDAQAKALLKRAQVTEADTSGLRTLRSDLSRILVDQGFRMIRRMAAAELREKGWTTAEWGLSPLHKVRDVCDDLAGQRFALEDWPEAPHAHCGCMPINPA